MGFERIMVTGASGMLGRDLVPYLEAKGYQVTAMARRDLDLLGTTDHIAETVLNAQPQIIIHAAAYTDVDGAENDPELAMAVNKDGTRKLALAAREVDAIMVYVSTDFVFDGLKHTPYTPSDKPNPVNTYGLSKHYGELMVSELMDTYYVVRTSWVYGVHKRNFVQFVLESARQGREVKAAEDMVGSPTWTGSLSTALEKIMTSGAFGIYHAGDAGIVSRYEQARTICHAAGLSSDHIRPVRASELPLKANRPLYSALDCGDLAVPSWETAFHAYLEQYKSLRHA